VVQPLGATIIDECHALAGETLGEIVRESSTRLMLGASATPAKTETKGQIVYSLVGPVVAETPREALYARGVLVRPTVEVVYTGHDDVFWPTHDATPEQDEATGRRAGGARCRTAARPASTRTATTSRPSRSGWSRIPTARA
jgi:superfamily II DNA or RNA helicase